MIEELDFERLPIRIDEGRPRVDLRSEGSGVGIVTATEYQSVHTFDHFCSPSGQGRKGYGDSPTGIDGSDVGSTKPQLVFDQITGDSNERLLDAGGHG